MTFALRKLDIFASNHARDVVRADDRNIIHNSPFLDESIVGDEKDLVDCARNTWVVEAVDRAVQDILDAWWGFLMVIR